MTDRQRIHVGMVNSYNILTKKAKVMDIIESSIPIFAHIVDHGVKKYEIDLMISYFESIEEYEKCIELKCISQLLFNDDGSEKDIPSCKCDMPSYGTVYDETMFCSRCNNQIVYEPNN
jgi:hypothetical protein